MISKQNKIKFAGTIIIGILICFSCIIIYRRVFQTHNNQTHFVSESHIELDEPNQVAIEQSFEATQKSVETIDSNLFSSVNIQNNLVDLPLDPRATPKYIEAKERVPVHPWHTERVTNIRSESIEQLIENIANFDDYQFAITSNGSGYFPGEMASEVGFVINLFRVRRLFEEGINNPKQVIPILHRAYQQVHKSWLDSREEDRQRMLEIKRVLKSKGDILSTALKEPDLFMKNRTSAVAMTYLLAELQDHDSLPILLEGYQKHRNWIEEYGEGKKVAPVPTPMTLYAMHRLAVTLPENKMDSQTLAARNAYLEWANKYVPEPEILKATAWNADYNESDPYRRMADPKGQVLIGQPSIYMARYPYKLKNGTFFFDGSMEDEQQKEKEWADLLIPFVEAAIK